MTLRYAYGMTHRDRIDGAGRQVRGRRRSARREPAEVGGLGAARGLRRRQPLGRARAGVGRLPAAHRVGVRGGVRRTTRSRRAATTSTRWATTSATAAGCTTCCRSPTPSPSWRARSCATRSSSSPRLPRGFVPYGTGPLCTRFDLGTSNDLDFWLLLAAAEYGLGARDPDFFDEPLPFYDTKRDDLGVGAHQDRLPPPGVDEGPERRLHRWARPATGRTSRRRSGR